MVNQLDRADEKGPGVFSGDACLPGIELDSSFWSPSAVADRLIAAGLIDTPKLGVTLAAA